MVLEVGDDHLRDGHRSHARVGLGQVEYEGAVGEFLILLLDPNRAMQEIEMTLTQGADLAEAQSADLAKNTATRGARVRSRPALAGLRIRAG